MIVWSAEIKELETLYTAIKGQLPDLEKELGRLIKADDENMVLLYSRRCLEVIITDLCEYELKRPRKTEPLKGIIDKLHHEEKVPSHIIASMHGLNDLSTFGAHPKEFDPEQVKPVLSNLNIIIKWYLKYKDTKVIEEAKPVSERTPSESPFIKEDAEGKRIEQVIPFKSTNRKLVSGMAILAILIIAALFVYPKIFNKDKLKNLRSSDGRISIAVMPFKNLTADTMFNIWQPGLQNLLITSLSNSEELSVRQYETMDKIFRDSEHTNYASITPSFASNVAVKLQANTVIIGNIFKTGNRIRVTANLMDSRSEEVFKSYEIDGNTEDDFFHITDSLSHLIKNYLEIKELEQKYTSYDLNSVYTSSAEAFKYYIQGRNYHGRLDYNSAIELYNKAINIDTNFVSPILMLSYVYADIGKVAESKKMVNKAYNRINSMPHDIQLQIMEVKAAIDKKPKEQIKYLEQYLAFNPYSTIKLYTIGWAYFNTNQWEDAIDAFEKGIELNKPFSSNYTLWIWQYVLLGNAYHKIGEHDKEMKIYEEGLKLHPKEAALVAYWQSVCALSQGDTAKANYYLTEVKSIGQREKFSESEILSRLASIHYEANLLDKSKELYQRALFLNPQSSAIKNDLAYLLINKDIDVYEGFELISQVFEVKPDNWEFLYTYGLGLYKQGKFKKALEFLEKSWESRPYYDHEHFQYLEEAKKAAAG
jgi:tetratricopeptide (TPR) repeat protein